MCRFMKTSQIVKFDLLGREYVDLWAGLVMAITVEERHGQRPCFVLQSLSTVNGEEPGKIHSKGQGYVSWMEEEVVVKVRGRKVSQGREPRR